MQSTVNERDKWNATGDVCQSVFIEAVRAKAGLLPISGHRSKEVEIVDADQPVRVVCCGLEEAWQYWKGTQAPKRAPCSFI